VTAQGLWRRAVPAAALVLVASAAAAQGPQTRVTVSPGVAKLGERVIYRGEATGPGVRWVLPDSGGAFSWGSPRMGVSRGHPSRRPRFGLGARTPAIQPATPDTTWIEIPLQVFELGVVNVPGLHFHYRTTQTEGLSNRVVHVTRTGRLATARLVIVPVLSAQDSAANLRPLRGPLAAPWWERVPWSLVAVALLLIALAIALFLWWRRRRPTPAEVVPAAARSPAARALAALAELRALQLPAQGRFGEHAFRLGQILRRYLEATVPTTRPGDTTPELLRHLGDAGLPAEELRRLAGLLRVWDRVKFARESFSAEVAARTEEAVEAFVSRGSPRVEEAA
jgi:hypothetical protein